MNVVMASTGEIVILALNSAAATILEVASISALNDGALHHVVISWDLSVPVVQIYVDGVSDKAVGTEIDDTIGYSLGAWVVGEHPSGVLPWTGELGQILFDSVTRVDLSVAENLARFYNVATGEIQDFGTNGAKATGIQPIAYMLEKYGEELVNRGTGGDFTTETGDVVETTPEAMDAHPDAERWNEQVPTNLEHLNALAPNQGWCQVGRLDTGDHALPDATLASIPGLRFSMEKNERWMFYVFGAARSPAADDFRLNITTPSGTTWRMGLVGTPSTIIGNTSEDNGLSESVFMGTNGTLDDTFILSGLIENGTATGEVQVRAAKNADGGADGVVYRGVTLIAFRQGEV